MNQGRIWCVVHPTVGLPLLLGSVALTSLAVHTAIMTHTTWMGNYWMGSARTRVSDNAVPAPTGSVLQSGTALSMTIAPVPTVGGATPTSFVITVAPAHAATSVASVSPPSVPPARTASAD